MLTEEAAKTLGFKNKFNHKIQQPNFVKEGTLWVKEKYPGNIPPSILQNKHKYGYLKKGKTFGFEVKRYIEYYNGTLLYFEDQTDKQCKGYCKTQNLYMYYLTSNNAILLHLTNGIQYSQFYFTQHKFYREIGPLLKKEVVQLNFIEKYSLIEMLGKGTYSKVYLARNKQNQQKYAIKYVGKKDKNGVSTKNIVEEEKKIFALLQTPFACTMEQFYEDDNNYIFVLEYISGRDLMAVFRQKQEISLNRLIQIFKGILQGLAYIHAKNIMHRDLKPQNIMIDDLTYTPKLIDFGLSLLFDAKTQKKRYKRCGTMGYMAYEVIHNTSDKKKVYDCKCDIFSFGIIVHMLLLGFNPLKGKNYNQTVQKNEQCNIALNKQEVISKYGAAGYNFIKGLLQKESSKRLTAEEALKSEFLQTKFQSSKDFFENKVEQTTQLKQDQAQYEEEQQQEIKIPKFQNFMPNKNSFQNRGM